MSMAASAADVTRTMSLIAAYEAALSVASEVNLEVVLQRIVDLAREVVPSRYAALGVADDAGRIVTFTTSGITDEVRAGLGPLPEGHGLLGELIERRRPMLISDIAADPRSVGFPKGHPPMRTLLGVPIISGDRAVGNLYLSERVGGGHYGGADLRVVEILAAHAATAIERARLHDEVEAGRLAAEQLKDDFLSLVSHEFRTPMTAIHGGAYLLARQGDGLDPETRRELLEDVLTESGRLVRMLANMLSLAATMAGRTELRTEPVLLERLVRRVTADVARRSPGFVFAVDLPDGLPPVEGDGDRLEQVLGNLYENAVKYSPTGGTVRTTATSDGRSVTLEVADEGIGIAPEHVPHVFERFRRPGADPSVRGMGLGLYLSRLLVTAQGGRIEARSPGVGLGAVFAVTLPVALGWSDDETGLRHGEAAS